MSLLFSCVGNDSISPIDTSKGTSEITGSMEGQYEPAESGNLRGDAFKKASSEAEAALSAVPEMDFNGYDFIITGNSREGIFGDLSEATTLSREKYNRMETLAMRLNVNIIYDAASAADIYGGLKNEKNSGTVYTHLIYLEERYVGMFLYNDLIGNVESLPFVDVKKPYYDAEFCAEMQTPSGLYALYGDACKSYEQMAAVFYNDTMTQRLGLSDPCDMVGENSWTYDKMLEYAKSAVASSSEGNTVYGILNADTEGFFRSAYVSSGIDSVDFDTKTLSLKDNREVGDAVSSKIRDMLGSGAYSAGMIEDKTPSQIFSDGRGMFYLSSIGSVKEIYNMKDVWGVLPIPTVSGGGYYLPHGKDTSVICYPRSAQNLNEIGIMIESMFACSYKIIDTAYRDTFFHYYVRNEKSMDSMLYLFERSRSDFSLLYGEEFSSFGNATLQAFVDSCWGGALFSERFAAARTAANRSLGYIK